MTLEPGDVITTGTPPGVGMGMKPQVFLKRGDVMTLGIEGLGEQLVAEADAHERGLGAHDLAQHLLHVAQPCDVVVHAQPAGRAEPPVLLVE